MNKKILLILFILSSTAYAATRYIDVIKSQLGSFVLIEENELRVGAGTDVDIKISANNGDASIPYIFYEAANNSWGAANDGSTEDVFALLDAAQVFNNKTFDDEITIQELSTSPSNPSAGYKKFYAKDDGLVYTLNSSGEEIPIGSGTGAGGINFISNPDAEINAADWNTYSDTAGVAPVDGTGGTANITFTRNTTTPLRGSADFELSKDAANRQGQGASTDFTIDNFDQDRVNYIRIDYNAEDANYNDGDIGIYIYDVTNSTVINPNPISLDAGSGVYSGVWVAAANSVSYRLIFHVSSTNADAYDVYFDNIKVGPFSELSGEIGNILPTWREVIDLTSSGDFTGGKILVTRVGDQVTVDMIDDATHASSSSVSSAAGLIPSWAVPDESKANVYSSTSARVFRVAVLNNGSLSVQYRDWSGDFFSGTGVNSFASISYNMNDSLGQPAQSISTQKAQRCEVVDVSSDANFTAGELKVCKDLMGKVTVQRDSSLDDSTFTSTTSVSSSGALIPEWARPAGDVYNSYRVTGGVSRTVRVRVDGTIRFDFTSAQESAGAFTISYLAVDADTTQATIIGSFLASNMDGGVDFGRGTNLIAGWASFGGESDGSRCDSSPCTRYRAVGIIGNNMSATRASQGAYPVTVTGFKPNSNISCRSSADVSTSGNASMSGEKATDYTTDSSGEANFGVNSTTNSISSSADRTDTFFHVYCIGERP